MNIIKKIIKKETRKELKNMVVLAGGIKEGINCPIGNIEKLEGRVLKYKVKHDNTVVDFKDAITGEFLVRIEPVDFYLWTDTAMEIHTTIGFQFNFIKMEYPVSVINPCEYEYGVDIKLYMDAE